MRTLKVFGGRFLSNMFPNGMWVTMRHSGRIIICAYSRKHASELTGISYSEIMNYFSETGNETELSIATEIGAWVTENHFPNKEEYKRVI